MRIARGRLKKPNVCCLRSRKRSLLAGGTTLSARGFRGALRSCIPHADPPRGWRECLYGGRICPHASIPGRDIPSALGDEGWGCDGVLRGAQTGGGRWNDLYAAFAVFWTGLLGHPAAVGGCARTAPPGAPLRGAERDARCGPPFA